MGCSINKENIESEILIVQLKKIKIKDERKKLLQKYKDLTGERLIRPKIPDYIDHEEIQEIKIKHNTNNKEVKITKESSSSTKSNSRKIIFETNS
jgi:hypothetical protein